MITVLGATGQTGRIVADRLLAAGRKVRAVARSSDRLRPLAERGADTSAVDVFDDKALSATFRDAEAAYVLVPPDYSQPDLRRLYNRFGDSLESALRTTGLRRIVFLSSLGAELPEGTGPITGLHDLEQRLSALAIDVLVLRPGYFYENFYSSLPLIKHQGLDGGAIAPDVPFTMTAARDIGAVAADALSSGTFRGVAVREVLGPRDYSMRETARIIGEKIGKPDLSYVQFPEADFKASLMQFGFSSGAADAFVDMSRAVSEGRIRSQQGRRPDNTAPTPFEALAEELALAYRAVR
jgi:uncharacterized protein YbjT (DUF2867 family)